MQDDEITRRRLRELADKLLSRRTLPPSTIDRLIDDRAVPLPLIPGDRTIMDRLRQRWPFIPSVIDDHEIVGPESLDDLAVIRVRIKIEGIWCDYSLEIVA